MEQNLRILVVDSDPVFIETARQAFSGLCTVTYARTEAEGMVRAKVETPDLVLLGRLEPRGASHRLAARLEADTGTSSIPLLVVDVKPEDYARKGWRWSDGFGHNIKGYVWRPISAAELKTTAEGILQRARAGAMSLTEVAAQTEEILKRIDQLKRLLGSGPES